jgi:hypothetical protein
MPARPRKLFFILVIAALAGLAAFAAWKFVTYAETRSTRILEIEKSTPNVKVLGASRFLFDDLGGLNTRTLETNAFPWKVIATALVMEEAAREKTPPRAEMIPRILQRYGWITPVGIDNWPDVTAPSLDKPVGIVSGEINRQFPLIRLEVANMGCAACHAGMSYDAEGEPTGRLWLGSTNSSRYFDGYTRAIFDALRYTRQREEELMATIPKIFPNVHPDELKTIRAYVLPQIAKRLDAAESNNDILVQFDHGGAGITNGIAALKLRLDDKPSLVSKYEHGYASIPDLYGRRLRSSVLYDGLYSLEANKRFVERHEGDFTREDHQRLSSIVAFFIVPSMGIRASDSEAQAGRISDILDWSLDYQPQPFPGSIDREKALAGSQLYGAQCESCHGRYTPGIDKLRLISYPNKWVAQANMNSDPERWKAISDRMITAINKTPVANRVNADNAEGYVAPILSGLWTSAPYLHNGSVPTLWHLLHADARPKKFYVGGHKLDYTRVGIDGAIDAEGIFRYPETHRAWSTPVLIDTAAPGLSNRGHEREFASLSEADMAALIEYMKLL